MVNISFRTESGEIILSVKGHANQAPKGQDIVCASASILTFTVASLIDRAFQDGKLLTKPMIGIDEGNAVITCKPKPYWYKNMKKTFNFAMEGFKLLADQYPQYVAITA